MEGYEKSMEVCVKRENWDGGIWMELPVSDEREKQIMEELEAIAPPPMFPFIGDVVLRAYLLFNTKGKKRKCFKLPMLGGKLKILEEMCELYGIQPVSNYHSNIWNLDSYLSPSRILWVLNQITNEM